MNIFEKHLDFYWTSLEEVQVKKEESHTMKNIAEAMELIKTKEDCISFTRGYISYIDNRIAKKDYKEKDKVNEETDTFTKVKNNIKQIIRIWRINNFPWELILVWEDALKEI